MKYKRYFLLSLVVLLTVSCSNLITVKSDYDKDVNLSLYKTYTWLPSNEIEMKTKPLIYNELTDKRIRLAVEKELQSKGIQLTTTNPAMHVHYHIIIDNKTAVNPSGYGYNYGPYWMRNRANVFQYREGTLIIDLMDSENKNLIWRGWGVTALGDNSVSLTEEEISYIVIKILQAFPPSK